MYIHQPTCSHISEVVSAFNKVTKRYSHASLYAMTHPPFIHMFVLNYSNTIGKYAYTQTHTHTHIIYIILGSFIIFVFLICTNPGYTLVINTFCKCCKNLKIDMIFKSNVKCMMFTKTHFTIFLGLAACTLKIASYGERDN